MYSVYYHYVIIIANTEEFKDGSNHIFAINCIGE